MKLIAETQEVEKIGNVAVESEFRIRASATSFAILSSGLYSNKILAIVRELSCNAYDGHKAKGNEDIPFEIKLPTTLDPMFHVKDFGIGLSYDQVMTIFTTYFESTKNDSDDYIGQLGLGSKSPFSYTNQFTVESRFDGVRSVYSMFINDAGIPACVCMGSEPTDEPTGLTVSLSVKQNDHYRFREAAENALMYFKPYPNVIGGHHSPNPIKYLLIKDDWALRDDDSSYAKPYVIQGFVRYPIDVDQLESFESGDLKLTDEAKSILKTPIDIIVPIGHVQVAPSREHLSYDSRSITNLINFLNGLVDKITPSMQEVIDSADNIWDARRRINTFTTSKSAFRRLYEKLISANMKLSYKGVEIDNFYDVRSSDLTNMYIYSYYPTSRRRYGSGVDYDILSSSLAAYAGKNKAYGFLIRNNTVVIHNDANVPRLKMRQYVVSLECPVVELTAENKKVPFSDTADKFIAEIGIPITDVIKSSDLVANGSIDMTSKKRAPRGPIDKSEKPVFCGRGFQYSYNSGDWYRETIDMTAGGYFVTTHRSAWVDDHLYNNVVRDLGAVIAYLKKNNVIPQNVNVVGFNKTDFRKYGGQSNWIDIKALFIKTIRKNKGVIAKNRAVDKLKASQYSTRSRQLEYLYANIDKTMPLWHKLDKFFSHVVVTDGEEKKGNIDNLITRCLLNEVSSINAAIEIEAENIVFGKTVDTSCLSEYPMVETIFDITEYIRPMIGQIIDYIKLVDSVRVDTQLTNWYESIDHSHDLIEVVETA